MTHGRNKETQSKYKAKRILFGYNTSRSTLHSKDKRPTDSTHLLSDSLAAPLQLCLHPLPDVARRAAYPELPHEAIHSTAENPHADLHLLRFVVLAGSE